MPGQILNGNDYEQNVGGTGVGAYVPVDENTHENQIAMEKVQQRNLEYQKQKAADEEKEALRRKKALLDVQVDPKGIRPIDQQQYLDNQKMINEYTTQAIASDKDPFDPKNAKEFQRLSGMMNAQKVFVGSSAGLNKQIGDEVKKFQEDKAGNYHPDSERVFRRAATISMPDYLRGDDPDVGLGRTLLKPADKFDDNKYTNDLVKGKGSEWEEKQGTNLVRYQGTDFPGQKDAAGNTISGTSGREVFAKAYLSNPRAKKHMEDAFSDPSNAPLARQAQLQSDKILESTGNYVDPLEIYTQNAKRYALTKSFKNSHEDPDAAEARKLRSYAQRKDIDHSMEEEIGAVQYHRVQNALAAKGQTYINDEGRTISSDFTGEKIGVGLNADGKTVPEIITSVDVTDPDKPRIYTNLSEEASKKSKGGIKPYVEMSNNKFILNYLSPILKNAGSKDVSISWKGAEKAGKEDFTPGMGYDAKKYVSRTYGEEIPKPKEEVVVPQPKRLDKVLNAVKTVREVIKTGKIPVSDKANQVIPILKSKSEFDKLPSGSTYKREVDGVMKTFKKP